MEVRTRFAPSPTGYMHLGNLRTAYFCKDKDSTDELAVFNRVVILKDSFKVE